MKYLVLSRGKKGQRAGRERKEREVEGLELNFNV